jgi:hypothetical protein
VTRALAWPAPSLSQLYGSLMGPFGPAHAGNQSLRGGDSELVKSWIPAYAGMNGFCREQSIAGKLAQPARALAASDAGGQMIAGRGPAMKCLSVSDICLPPRFISPEKTTLIR